MFIELLKPVTPSQISQTYWAKKPLFLRGSKAKCRLLGFTWKHLWSICRREDVRVVAQFHGARGHQEIVGVPGAVAHELFESGMTVVLNNVDARNDQLHRLAKSAQLSLGYPGRVTVSCFASPHGAGYAMHWDEHSAVVIQLEGEKRWEYSSVPAVDGPMRNCFASGSAIGEYSSEFPASRIVPPGECAMSEEVLQPGDLLYLPPGTWHRPIAQGESLALTISFNAVRFESIFASVVGNAMKTHSGWRSILPLAPDGDWRPEQLPPEARRFVEQRLHEVRTAILAMDADDFAASIREMMCHRRDDNSMSGSYEERVSLESRVRASHRIWWSRPHRGVIRVAAGHRMVRLPAEAAAALEVIVERAEWNLSELAMRLTDVYDAEDVVALVAELCEAELLNHSSPSGDA